MATAPVPSRLSQTHILAQARLRHLVADAVGRSWRNLPGYDERDVPAFLAQAVPLVEAGKRRSGALTEAYVAAFMGRAPLGVRPEPIRNGADPREVYRRPFIQLWSALGSGTMFQDAVSAAGSRAEATAAMDVQLASRSTFQAVQEADDGIYGYQRVADGGACEFCQAVDGAYLKSADASPLHNNCGCGLEPLTSVHPRARYLPDGRDVRGDGFAVRQHGELGPTLADPSHDFTTAAEALH